MSRDSFVGEFFIEFLPAFITIVGGLAVAIGAVGVAIYYATGPTTCRAYADKMQIETSWGFWTDCMVKVQGQWLPWSDVVPVERNGTIVFVPKPQVILKSQEQQK